MLDENPQFKPTSFLFGARVTPLEFAQIFGIRKQEFLGYQWPVCAILPLAILIQYQRMTDRRIDTRRQHIPH